MRASDPRSEESGEATVSFIQTELSASLSTICWLEWEHHLVSGVDALASGALNEVGR